jgi:hypothetical protein
MKAAAHFVRMSAHTWLRHPSSFELLAIDIVASKSLKTFFVERIVQSPYLEGKDSLNLNRHLLREVMNIEREVLINGDIDSAVRTSNFKFVIDERASVVEMYGQNIPLKCLLVNNN